MKAIEFDKSHLTGNIFIGKIENTSEISNAFGYLN